MTKVLVLIGVLDKGGTEMGLLRNMPRVNDDKGIDIHICTLSRDGSLIKEFKKTNLTLHLPHFKRPTSLFGRIAYKAYELVHLTKTVFHLKPDIIHCFLPHAYLAGTIAAFLNLFPGKIFYSRPSLNDYQKDHPVVGWLERHILHRRVDMAISNAQQPLGQLQEEGIPASKCLLLHNGIDPHRFQDKKSPLPANLKKIQQNHHFIMTAVANIHPYKGHQDLVEALHQIRDKLTPKWVVVCAGRDVRAEKEKVLAKITSYNLDAHFIFLGDYEHIPALLRMSHLHIHPSHQEGLSNSIIEGALSGCPIVATDVGGTNEIIDHEATGLLVPPHTPVSLGKAILNLATDEHRRQKMGLLGNKTALQRFSLEKSVKAYRGLYKTCGTMSK